MKVLIVDDDSLVRIGLKTLINWELEGFDLIGEASNGKIALEMLEKNPADIIISDIQMDVMDGIELLTILQKQATPPAFLVLSNYSDFQLVRKAMQLGACNYLLKLEANPEHLLQALGEIRLKIETEQGKQKQIAGLDRFRNINAMRKNFLRDLTGRFYADEEEIKESMRILDIHLDREHVYCMMIKAGELYRFEEMPDEQLYTLNISIINIVEEIAGEQYSAYCYEGTTGKFYLLLSHKDDDSGYIKQDDLVDLGKKIVSMLDLYANTKVTISIGDGRGPIKAIAAAYHKAIQGISYGFFSEQGDVFFYNEKWESGSKIQEDTKILQPKAALLKALHNLDGDGISTLISDIITKVQLAHVTPNGIRSGMIALFFIISEFFDSYDLRPIDVLKQSYRDYFSLSRIATSNEVVLWLEQLKDDLLDYISAENSISYTRIIAQAKHYLSSHFTEDITLKEVADTVHISPSYLSAELKKQTGLAFKEYLTSLRIEKAKNMLEETDLKIYEVSEKVGYGYDNSYYFDRVFKKMTGFTPGDYKRKATKK
jgi:YesN/AraC family two-component response regulator